MTTGPAGRPERTLGWEVLWWTTHFIRQPDGDTAGEEWRYTPEQVNFVLWWYALSAETRWIYMRGVLRRSKGWGKSPFVASLALAELCGPVRFERWALGGERRPWRPEPYRPGEAIGRPAAAAWVQLAGTAEKQTTNTMSMVLAMCAESPITGVYGLDLGLTRIYSRAGGRLEPITASFKTAEGARPTAVFEDETQHYYEGENGGVELDRVNRRNVGKSPGGTARVLETTNAHGAGEQSVAERSYLAWLAREEGRTQGAGGLLYDSREAPPETDLADGESLLAGLAAAYGDSTWVHLERIRDEVWDPSTPPQEARRYYLNQVSSAVDAWIAQPEWAGCADATKVVAHGEAVTLGFDGSRGRVGAVTDATALIGCRVSDGHLFEVGVWEEPAGPAGDEWQVPELLVESALEAAFARYNVVGCFCDPALWWDAVSRWEGRYHRRLRVKVTAGAPMHFRTNSATTMVKATAEFHAAVLDGKLTHDGSHYLTKHVLNARRNVSRSGVQVAKEHPESRNKIDAAVAAILAWQARLSAVSHNVGTGTFAPRRVR